MTKRKPRHKVMSPEQYRLEQETVPHDHPCRCVCHDGAELLEFTECCPAAYKTRRASP
jgi:hypothetical protein